MNIKQLFSLGLLILLIAGAVCLKGSIYILDEVEQAVVVQLGAPVGEPVTTPGMHLKFLSFKKFAASINASSPGMVTPIRSQRVENNLSQWTPLLAGDR